MFSRLSSALLLCTVGVMSDEICFEGFVMDNFCINRGTLLDAPSITTLINPDLHSLHCLLDVAQCTASGYELLSEPAEGSNTYGRAYRLDATGNTLVLAHGRSIGMGGGGCTTCTGGTGNETKGLRVTVKGKITTPATDSLPATIAVSEVLSSDVGCVGGNTEPDVVLGATSAFSKFVTIH
eukprot:Awhi_evm1s14926